MNKRILKRSALLSLMLLCTLGLALIFVNGCSDNATKPAPMPENAEVTLDWLQNNVGGNGPQAASGKLIDNIVSNPSLVAMDYDAATIDSRGGTLELSFGADEVVFSVPRGAVPENTEIKISGYKLSTALGDMYIYDCEPSGIQFARPITVEQPINRITGAPAVMFYLGDDSAQWKFESLSTVLFGSAKFQIWHFSKYGIS